VQNQQLKIGWMECVCLINKDTRRQHQGKLPHTVLNCDCQKVAVHC